MAKKKSKEKVVKDNAERWLLTYADLMNLLLIFFIILFAMSQVNKEKVEKLANSLRNAFGMEGGGSILPNSGGSDSIIDLGGGVAQTPAPTPTTSPASSGQGNGGGSGKSEDEQMGDIIGVLQDRIKGEGLEDQIIATVQERGIKISIKAYYLFASGSAEVNRKAVSNIVEIGKMLTKLPTNMIRVEGHTDTVPMRSRSFPTNWELSSARATNVLRILVDQAGINPKMISAVGYGEYHPDYPNDTEENRAKNRRVDIVILKQDFSVGEAETQTGK